jgi:DNA-binding response OmpR family regulator
MFDKFQPDIVLLDVMMPRLNGYDVCSRLKHNQQARRVPVMILTAMEEDEARVLARQVGADDFLLKPCSPVELLGHIQMLLSRTTLPPLDAPHATA